MGSVQGIIALLVALAAATAFGLWWNHRNGRLKAVVHPEPLPDDAPPVDVKTPDRFHHGGERLSAAELGGELGEKATLVHFSTAFCQPCRATDRILDEVAGMVDGVTHIEVDAESHLDLVRHLDVRRTPTVLILDSHGAIKRRASGLPRKPDIIAALGEIL